MADQADQKKEQSNLVDASGQPVDTSGDHTIQFIIKVMFPFQYNAFIAVFVSGITIESELIITKVG